MNFFGLANALIDPHIEEQSNFAGSIEARCMYAEMIVFSSITRINYFSELDEYVDRMFRVGLYNCTYLPSRWMLVAYISAINCLIRIVSATEMEVSLTFPN